MDFRRLNYFIAVAETLNFSRAAERLHISQPPLSQQIQLLEAELGVLLLERTRRSVALTQAGQLFYTQAQAILVQYEAARAQCVLAHEGLAGKLQLAFTASVPLFEGFSRLLQGFRSLYPHIAIDLQHLSTGEQLAALAEQRIDVGFLRPSPHFQVRQPIDVRSLWHDELVVACASNHPLAQTPGRTVALQSLLHEAFILHPQALGCGLFEHISSLSSQAGFAPNIVQEARETSTTLALVAANLGISIVPSIYERIKPPGVEFLTIEGGGAQSQIVLASPKNQPSLCLQTFLRYVDEFLATPQAAPVLATTAAAPRRKLVPQAA